MQLLMNLVDDSKQLNQAQFSYKLNYHGPKGRFKIIHQGLMIPGLAAPLHYFNFLTIIGQPNAPMLRNESAIKHYPLDTVTAISSISAHMLGHLNAYSILDDCTFGNEEFHFGSREFLKGKIPHFQFIRDDAELSVNLHIETRPVISHFTKFKFGLFDHWSLMCHCTGEIKYKGVIYPVNHLGSFEYARAVNLPYLPLCFFTYQIINLNNQRQLLLAQIRNNFNQIVQSRIYLRDLKLNTSEMFDEKVYFKVHRVYPKVRTPNQQDMYLPREFEWSFKKSNRTIHVNAQSRGDYKFGLAAGYVGSFQYQVEIDGIKEEGESGYCEYIDCRPLKWQEKYNHEKCLDKLNNCLPCTLKK